MTLEHPLFIGGMCQNCKVCCGAGPGGTAGGLTGCPTLPWGPQCPRARSDTLAVPRTAFWSVRTSTTTMATSPTAPSAAAAARSSCVATTTAAGVGLGGLQVWGWGVLVMSQCQ